MKIPKGVNRFLSVVYLRRRGVEWRGEIPSFNALNPPHFAAYGRLVLGSGVKFFTHMGPTLIQVDDGATITIGNHATLGSGVWIRSGQKIVISDHVLIAPGVKVFDLNMHPVYPKDMQTPKPVVIGRNCWIGVGSIILPGVQVGEHSVIGAGSVVTRSVPSKTVVAGNPARIIRTIDCHRAWVRGDS